MPWQTARRIGQVGLVYSNDQSEVLVVVCGEYACMQVSYECVCVLCTYVSVSMSVCVGTK